MSRARSWIHPDGTEVWFNVYDPEATVQQLEVLAEVTGVDIDDLLDEAPSQRTALYRLNEHSDLIPKDIIEIKRARALARKEGAAPICRLHGDPELCEGRITKHHFVPRWLMLELPEYLRFAPRSYCTIPACVGWHRELHKRGNGNSKSIAPYLTDDEKKIAHLMIEMLRQERPKIYALLAGGDRNSYEWQLIQDWRRGLFDVTGAEREPFPRWQLRAHSSMS